MSDALKTMESAAIAYRQAEERLAKAQLDLLRAQEAKNEAERLAVAAKAFYERASTEWRKGLLELTPAIDLLSRRGA